MGLEQRAGATDTLLVNLTGTCLTASGGYATLTACTNAATQGWTFVLSSGPDHVETTYGLRNTPTGMVLTVGPNRWAGTRVMLYPDYAVSGQRFWLDSRYTG